MHFFNYRGDVLFAEEVDLRALVEAVGTPTYVYSYRTLKRHCTALHRAFGDRPHLTCYAVKANGNLALLRTLAREGIGADIVSGGELFRARAAGFPGERIVYSGVGKTEAEMRYALEEGVMCFNVESLPELEILDRVAGDMGEVAPVALRVNPDVDPRTHPHIVTGLKENKFGIAYEDALDAYRMAASLPNIKVIGVDAHIGSQITSVEPFVESVRRLAELVERLGHEGMVLEHIDIGGGLGIRYRDESPPEPEEWVEAILPVLEPTGLKVIFEPGRSLVGNAGILLTKVLYVKETSYKNFVVVDAAMTDLIRPALYGAYHEVLPVERRGEGEMVADIVGPVCESGDFLAKDRSIERPRQGDILAVMSAGAYGFVMSSNYNARPRPAEVFVKGNRFQVVRERESYGDLVRGERFLYISN
ncbi:MAG TPA: diaminopimelate decarboxylase [Candidatus Latescibacteria bacterium]|nr:diaminopimelate decarboxylase [Candidatus Latescibacterota bacterium]